MGLDLGYSQERVVVMAAPMGIIKVVQGLLLAVKVAVRIAAIETKQKHSKTLPHIWREAEEPLGL